MSMQTLLVFDPGESTGWVFSDNNGQLHGGTAGKNHQEVAQLIEQYQPDVVVYETFQMYPGRAKSLYWNSFYPCEVIGVIKYMCAKLSIPIAGQQPSVRKYAGKAALDWEKLQVCGHKTEHTKDAYQHYRYYRRLHRND